jgi:tetratricopeptide (TPR) repeat protein
MILAAALLMMQGYSPETQAVQNRSRARAAERRAEERAVAAPVASGSSSAGSAGEVPLPPAVAARFQACLDAGTVTMDAGVKFAEDWRIDGGGYYARECMGFAYAKAERWGPALVAFEQAADGAEKAADSTSAARLWGQAGNAALAGGDAAKARTDFDAALAHGIPDGLAKGEIHLDRARALVVLGQGDLARKDFDAALVMAPQDPLAWLLSATLARRSNDLNVARKHIAQAVKLSPDDASVALEEGNIAILSSQDEVAKMAWQRAVKLAPDSGPGKSAAANLAQLATQPDQTSKPAAK